MNDFLLALACWVVSVCAALSPAHVEDVCQKMRECDDAVGKEFEGPGPLNATVVFRKIRAYIDAAYELVKCLHEDKETTAKIAKEIIDKKGPQFEIDHPWKYATGIEKYGWDGQIIEEYINWKMLTSEAWMDIEKYFDPRAYIPKELYTESPDDIVFP